MLYAGYKNEDHKKCQKVSKSSPRNMNNTLENFEIIKLRYVE